jgi:hypothetical protein
LCTSFWWGSLRDRDHWGDPDVDRRIILRWIFRKWEGVAAMNVRGNLILRSVGVTVFVLENIKNEIF